MKEWFLSIFALLSHPGQYLRNRTMVVGSKIIGAKGNDLAAKNSLIKKSEIKFAGKGNAIVTSGCEIYNSTIFLRGDGHTLVIEEGVQLYNVRIKIIGAGNEVRIGKKTTFGSGSLVCGGNNTHIEIGENCMLAEGLDVWNTDTHSIIKDGKLCNPPENITIGNHVWTGKDVAILKGVTVGDNAIVGMKSLVTKDIPSGCIAAGNPAKIIKDGVDWNRTEPR